VPREVRIVRLSDTGNESQPGERLKGSALGVSGAHDSASGAPIDETRLAAIYRENCIGFAMRARLLPNAFRLNDGVKSEIPAFESRLRRYGSFSGPPSSVRHNRYASGYTSYVTQAAL
jgi:hypothetical protein